MNEQVPRDNMNATLPHQTVCGREMTADPQWYPRAEYQGRTITFCTEFCIETFRSDPDHFYAAHSRQRDSERDRQSY